jgi:hypothetical protein
MNEEDVLLARTQDQVQRFLFNEVAALLHAEADEIEWEQWIASIRSSSEEAWLRCNAFLLAHTVARFLAGRAPANPAGRDAWVDAFVTSVGAQDTSAELVLWSAAPVANPMADRLSRTTSTLWILTRALRESQPLDDSRPGPFTLPVWISADQAGL